MGGQVWITCQDRRGRAAEGGLRKRVLGVVSSLPVSRVVNRIPRTGLPEWRKCAASNCIRPCRRNVVWRTARSEHTTGGEWRWLVATHAKP